MTNTTCKLYLLWSESTDVYKLEWRKRLEILWREKMKEEERDEGRRMRNLRTSISLASVDAARMQ